MNQPIACLPYSQYAADGFAARFAAGRAPDLSRFRIYPRGRDAITAVLRQLGLGRDDEVYIDTTSNSPFVSSCVTCNIFNRAKPARALSAATKMIFIIHEFGFRNPRADALRDEAKRRGIPVFVDSAHALSLAQDPEPGVDFQLVSLSKNLPLAAGGLLAGRAAPEFAGANWEMSALKDISTRLASFMPYWQACDDRRQKIFQRYAAALAKHGTTFDKQEHDIPFFYPLRCPSPDTLHHQLRDSGVGWGQANIPATFLLPCHALLSDTDVDRVIALVRPLL